MYCVNANFIPAYKGIMPYTETFLNRTAMKQTNALWVGLT